MSGADTGCLTGRTEDRQIFRIEFSSPVIKIRQKVLPLSFIFFLRANTFNSPFSISHLMLPVCVVEVGMQRWVWLTGNASVRDRQEVNP